MEYIAHYMKAKTLYEEREREKRERERERHLITNLN